MINHIALKFTFLPSAIGRTIPMDWSFSTASTGVPGKFCTSGE